MQLERRDLSQYVNPDLDEARIDRQWATIQAAGLPDGSVRRVAWRRLAWLAVPAVAGALLLAVLPLSDGDGGLPPGAVVQSGAEGFEMRLRDGSALSLSPNTELRVGRDAEAEVAVELVHGRAAFDVTKRADRRFAVRAGSVLVSVIGTRFSVRHDVESGTVKVAVTRGRVEVRRRDRPGQLNTLGEGEQLTLRLAEAPAVEEPAPAVGAQAELDEPARPAELPPAEVARQRPPSPPSASELFSRANVARRGGRLREAAAAYEALLAAHPRDGRAALAAFELGRIRMDALADPRGAIKAFARALKAGGPGAHAEDALARIAIAHDALGDAAACRKARMRYLSRYPGGVHRADLAGRCGD